MYKPLFFSLISGLLYFLTGCVAANEGSAVKSEQLNMKIHEQKDVINLQSLVTQQAPNLAVRGSRGISMSGTVGSLVSLATDAVKKVIANEQKKYIADYQFGLNDLYFYDQLSDSGPFDPLGMQFKGFTLVRTFINNAGNVDTAFVADIELDTTNAYEIMNNSIFKLKIKRFQLKYAKAKLSSTQKKKLNMDFEINFITSYVNDAGVLFENVTLGKFYFFLRDAPLNSNDANYKSYYKNLEGKKLTGRSFIVPRSFGYRKENEETVKTYNQGAYSLQVKVKESTKDFFVTKLLMDNATILIDSNKDNIKKELNKKLPNNMQ